MKARYPFRLLNFLTLTSYFTTILLISPTAGYATSNSYVLDAASRNGSFTRADEYFSEIYQGEILIPINLLGSVGKPGVYHIPKQTDLVRLLSLAGGTRADANLEDISIKRRSGETEKLINVNLRQLVSEKSSSKPINLEANDIVLVAPHEPLVSNNTLTVVSLAASLLGLVVSSIVIVNQLKR